MLWLKTDLVKESKKNKNNKQNIKILDLSGIFFLTTQNNYILEITDDNLKAYEIFEQIVLFCKKI